MRVRTLHHPDHAALASESTGAGSPERMKLAPHSPNLEDQVKRYVARDGQALLDECERKKIVGSCQCTP